MTRRQKLEKIFRTISVRSFVAKARKHDLHVPYSYELNGQSVSLWLSDSIEDGHMYDSNKDNEWVNEWYNELFNN